MFTNLDSPPVQFLGQLRLDTVRIQRRQVSMLQNCATEMNETLLHQFHLVLQFS